MTLGALSLSWPRVGRGPVVVEEETSRRKIARMRKTRKLRWWYMFAVALVVARKGLLKRS
jgi:hypothetical protein